MENAEQSKVDALNISYENIETYKRAQRERNQKIYNDKVKKLQDTKDASLAEIEKNIEDAKQKFIADNPKPLLPIQKFKSQDAYLNQVIENIPVHKVYRECSKPVFKDMKDVYEFNERLNGLYNLEGLKDIQLSTVEEKVPLLLKPIELLVDRFGEGRRWLIELGCIGIALMTLGEYRHFVLPALTLPLTGLVYTRYRNTSTLKKYCSAYFQAHNYSTDIESAIKELMIQNREKELTGYRTSATEKINRTYDMEFKKLKPPVDEEVSINPDEDSINRQYIETVNQLTREKADKESNLKYKLGQLEGIIQESSDKLDALGRDCKQILDENGTEGILPKHIHYGEVVNTRYGISYPYLSPTIKESCCITYDDASKEDAINFLKYYLLQLWTTVLPGNVKFEIIDTVDFGKDFADITVQEEKLIQVRTDNGEVNELLNSVTDELKRRSTTILRRYPNIEEYNKVMHAQDASLCPYIIYVNVNPQMEHLMHQGHQALIQQASECGILMINLLHKDAFNHLREDDYAKAIEMYNHHEYKVCFENNNIVDGLSLTKEETFTPVKFDKSKYVEVGDRMLDLVKNGGVKPLWYHEHRERNFPKNWTRVPIANVEVMPGNLNGEKDKPVTLLIGDANPHVLLAGKTGGGKSVLLNALIMSVCHNYSPDWVQFVGVDFKGVELLLYGKPVAMPHFRVASASRDVDYVLSLFNDLVGEMEARNKLFDKVLGFKNYIEFSSEMLKDGGPERIWAKLMDKSNKELQTLLETSYGKNLYKSITKNGKYPVLPRILFVIDEFADMFLISDELKAEVTKAIKTLAKKARSCGISMVFASQNMEGTVPEETLEQFPLRICVPCSENVSKTLLGNTAAALIERGYAIANDNPAEKEKANVFFKVAFEKTPDLREMIAEMNNDAQSLGYPKTIPIYDEAETYSHEDLMSRLLKNPKLHSSPIYVLGEPRIYQRVNMPVTLTLNFKERQNLCIIAKDKDVMNSMSVVFLDNYAKKNLPTYFHTADDEFLKNYDLVGRHTDVKHCEENVETKNLYPFLKNMRAHRSKLRETGGEIVPFYIILHGINSMMDFGVLGMSNESVQEFMRDNLLELNKLGIYFVLCTTSAKSMSTLFPFFTHTVIGGVDERDSGYLPELAGKALRKLGENQMFYINSDTGNVKSFKPYVVFKPQEVDESEYFSA